MGVRVYDPWTGTFLQSDPVQGGGANAYGYTDGDPVNETDLSGEICVTAGPGGPSRCGPPSWSTGHKSTKPERLVPASPAEDAQINSLLDAHDFPEPGEGVEPVAVRAANDQGWVLRDPADPTATGNENIIRIYDNGTMRIYNSAGHAINPETGLQEGDFHIDPGYKGPWNGVPKWWTGGG